MANRVLKRLTDIVVAAVGLAVLGPTVGLASVIAIRLTSPGPALFRQQRAGRGGKPFTIYKFRTMVLDAPDLRNADGSSYTAADDPRVTTVGRFLRRTSLDELPQLINVLRGDMSLVGPRPELPDQAAQHLDEHGERLSVRPGLTGLAQAAERNAAPWAERRRLDVEYARTWTYLGDLRILAVTLPAVLLGRNVHGRASASSGLVWSDAAWDSEVLGRRCARVDVTEGTGDDEAAARLVEDLRAGGYDYASARVPAGGALARSLVQAGFEELSTLVTLARPVPTPPVEDHSGVRPAEVADADAVSRVAVAAFTDDRFHSDPVLPRAAADRAIATWARNCVLGEAADHVGVVDAEDGEVGGFVACRGPGGVHGAGTIVLIASLQPGNGRRLVDHALAWCASAGAAAVEVGTQGTNERALRLYKGAGFEPVSEWSTLRWFSAG